MHKFYLFLKTNMRPEPSKLRPSLKGAAPAFTGVYEKWETAQDSPMVMRIVTATSSHQTLCERAVCRPVTIGNCNPVFSQA